MEKIIKKLDNKKISNKELINIIEKNDIKTDDLIKILNYFNLKYLDKREVILDEINKLEKNKYENIKEELKKNKYIYYPELDDDDFYEKLYKKKEFYQNRYPEIIEEKGKDIQYDLCPNPNKRYKLLSHQIFLKNYMSIRTPYNGILVFHGTGSGKTCTAIAIAETYKKILLSDSKKIFVLVSGDTIESNFKKEIHDINKGYDQCTFSDYQNYNLYSNDESKNRKANLLIEKYYEIEHYQRFANLIDLKYKLSTKSEFIEWIDRIFSNRVIIVDEVHNLHSKKEEDENTIRRYEALKLVLKYSQNVKLILLSATPMSHTSIEIIDILNLLLVNDNFKEVSKLNIFDRKNNLTIDGKKNLEKLFKGYVSYVRQENPYTFAKRIYPRSITTQNFINEKFNLKNNIFNKKSNDINLTICEMGEEQKKAYLNFLNRPKKEVNSMHLIQYGIIGYDNMEKNLRTGILKIPFNYLKGDKLKSISSKFYNLLENIENSPKGPIFIYSNFINIGILAISAVLIANGYKLSNHVSSKYKNNEIFSNSSKFKDKNKIRDKQNDKSDFKGYFTYISNPDSEETRQSLINLFNSESNRDGSKLKILIGTSVLKEGVSLKGVRQVHLMEPWYNKSKLEQVIGRGLRHCSHIDLDIDERYVEIFHYTSVLNKNYNNTSSINIENKLKKLIKSIDNDDNVLDIDFARSNNINEEPLISYDILMYLRAELLDKKVKDIEDILKRVAVDCNNNRKLNIDSIENDKDKYQCINDVKYDIEPNEINLDTYDAIFLFPYIQYVISIIKKHFENHYVLTYDELINNELFNEEVYKENNYYIIRKALYDMIPNEKTNFNSFIHVFKGKNNISGYIFDRYDSINNKNYYFFQEFDNEDVRTLSKMEYKPIYERISNIKYSQFNNLNQNTTLKLKIGTQDYNNWFKLSKTTDIVSDVEIVKKKKTAEHGKGSNYIKKYDPLNCHVNDAPIVGITIEHPDFKNEIWIRETNNDINQKNTKQFNTGKRCGSFKKIQISLICNNVFKYINNDVLKSIDIYELSEILINNLDIVKNIKNEYKNLVKIYNNKNITLNDITKFLNIIQKNISKEQSGPLCKILISYLQILQLYENNLKKLDNSHIIRNWFKIIKQEINIKTGEKTGRFLYTC